MRHGYWILALLVMACMMPAECSQNWITLTVHVHDGDLQGDPLEGVLISGQDGDGERFEEMTGEDGTAEISGSPGEWLFTFERDGYETLYLRYNATESEETAAYLERAD